MLITTQDEFADKVIIETLGLVKGNTIRARHVGKDIMAGLRNLVGGEITEYTKMLAESREQAIEKWKDSILKIITSYRTSLDTIRELKNLILDSIEHGVIDKSRSEFLKWCLSDSQYNTEEGTTSGNKAQVITLLDLEV